MGFELDRRFIYAVLFLTLLLPLVFGYQVKPARMLAAEKFYDTLDALADRSSPTSQNGIVFLVIDFGPNSKAENEPQARAVIEHLFRRRIPFALFSQYALAQPFLSSLPESIAKQLESENGEKYNYGKDWINLGFRNQATLLIQQIPKSDDLQKLFLTDERGLALSDSEIFKGVKTIRDIRAVIQLTSLVGTFENFVQYLVSSKHRPILLHGCTSITIPKAYIYLDSGQLDGLLEGIAGASWYINLLNEKFPKRSTDSTLAINTGIGVAHLFILFLIVLGNIVGLTSRRQA